MRQMHWRLKTSAWLVSLALLSWQSSATLASQNSNVALTVNQLMRQFTLRNTVAQVNQGLQSHVLETSGKLRGLAMGATPSNFPVDMGSVPGNAGLPTRDGAGRPIGYCAWDNNASSNAGGFLAGSAITNPMVYAVISPGVNGIMDTSCADIAANREAAGDDYLEIRYPQSTASQQFKTAVNTVAALASLTGTEGDVRLVLENNKLYSYTGGAWVQVSSGGAGSFSDDSATNGANAIAYTAGKVTVAEFAATAATLSSNLSVAGTSTLTGAVTAANGITVGSGGINVTGASSITGNTTITGDLGVSGAFTAASFSGNGSALTNLNASNIASGTVGAAFGGTGVNASAAANGSLLIGNGSGFSLGTLMGTADQVMVTNGAGSIQISLPQAISNTSSPTFGGMVLNGGLTGTTGTFSGNVSARRLIIGDSTGGVTTPNYVIGDSFGMASTPSGVGGNVSIGHQNLFGNTSGGNNVGIGINTLRNSATGHQNVALGLSALQNNTGSSNFAAGTFALISNQGDHNVAIGFDSLKNHTTGSNNIGFGFRAGEVFSAPGVFSGVGSNTGSNNIFLGANAGRLTNNVDNSVVIGANAAVSTSNTVLLGNSTQNVVLGANGDDGSGNKLQLTGGAKIIQNNDAIPGISITGKPIYTLEGSNNPNTGASMVLGVNSPDNTQLWFGEIAGYGSATKSMFRVRAGGSQIAYIDAVSGDGLTQMPLSLGTQNGDIAVGATWWGPANTALPSRFTVYGRDASQKVMVVQGVGGQTANLVEVQNSAASPLFTVGATGNVNVAGDLTGTTGSFSGNVTLTGSNSTLLLRPTTMVGGQYARIRFEDPDGGTQAVNIAYYDAGGEPRLVMENAAVQVDRTLYVSGATQLTGALTGTTGSFSGNVSYGNQTTIPFTRNVPSTVGDTIDIGTFSLPANGTPLFELNLNSQLSNFALNKRYVIAGGFNPTGGQWKELIPQNSSGPWVGNDYALDMQTTGTTISFRLRAVSMPFPTLNNVVGHLKVTGAYTSFTASSATGSAGGTPTLLTNSGSLMGVVDNKVGIGTAAPTTTLDVVGTGKFSGALTLGGALAANGGITLATGTEISQAAPAGAPGTPATFLRSTTPIGNAWIFRESVPEWGIYHYNTDDLSSAQDSIVLTNSGGSGWTSGLNSLPAGTRAAIILGMGNGNGLFAGKVGVGTNTPVANLDVVGTGAFTGAVSVGGALTGTTASFTGALSALRLNIGDSTGGVTRPNIVIGSGAMLGTPSGNGGNTAIGTNALASNTSGNSNTAIGHGSLFNNTTGERNFALGFEAMYDNTTGTGNIAIGESALRTNTTGTGNIAIGESALRFNTTAVNNIALGQGSLYFNSTGTSNIAIGRDTLFSNTTGADSVAIGVNALRNSTTANRNSALGYLALENTTTGSSSTAMGYRALSANTTGQNNVALGAAAGFETAGGSSTNANTTGSNNTFLGSYAMSGTTTQLSYATALGSEALVTTNNTIVLGRTTDNTVIGATGDDGSGNKLQVNGSAIVKGRTGVVNAFTVLRGSNAPTSIAFGRTAIDGSLAVASGFADFATNASAGDVVLRTETTSQRLMLNSGGIGGTLVVYNGKVGVNNISPSATFDVTGSGAFSGALSVGGAVSATRLNVLSATHDNIAIGPTALAANTSGVNNIALGHNALQANTDGNYNIAIGSASLVLNTTGTDNTAVGVDSLAKNTTGGANSAFGRNSLQENTTGSYNTGLGSVSLYSNTTGSLNTAVGRWTLYANTTGGQNTMLGAHAFDALAAGNRNVGIGMEVGSRDGSRLLTGGSDNSFIGAYSGPTSGTSTLNYATAIGAYAEVGTDNTIVLGRTTDKTVIGATGDDGSGNMLQVTGSVKATAFNTSSDRRLKANINMLGDDLLNSLSGLNAYSYRFISDRTQTIRYGVIAQEIAQLFPNAVSYDARGFMAVDYGALGAIAAAGVGKLNTRLNTLSTKVDKQGEQITALEKDLLKVDDRVKLLEAWKTDTNKRMDTMQTAIDLNIEKIAEHALKIASNTEKITTLEQATQEHATRLGSAEEGLGKLNAQWASTFAKSEDGNTLTVLTPNLVASNFTAQQIQASSAYTQRLEAEMARIATLEVDDLRANKATTGNLRATEVNTGSAQVFASTGSPAYLFTTAADGHYTVNVSAADGSYVTASVMVSSGVAKVVTVSNDGINLVAEGTMVKALANGKMVKASWIKMG